MTKILNETHKRSVLFNPDNSRQDTFSAAIPPGEIFHSARLTNFSPWPKSIVNIISQPRPGQSGNAEIVVQWECSPNSMVEYQIEVFTCPGGQATGVGPSITREMTTFLPSKHGFLFDNKFSPPTTAYLDTVLGRIPILDASKGLCGGMVFAALDFYNAGMPVPVVENLPERIELYDYIVKRLLQSFDLPAGPLNYIELMHPKYPDSKWFKGIFGLVPIGRAWRMIRVEWPKIKKELDAGTPCPLGLVLIKSTDLRLLGDNHQVLAYGYELLNNELTLFIYDPNDSRNDHITLSLNIRNPGRPAKVNYTRNIKIHCFFMGNYSFSKPPSI